MGSRLKDDFGVLVVAAMFAIMLFLHCSHSRSQTCIIERFLESINSGAARLDPKFKNLTKL